jgi:hypothetical protein
MRPLLILLGVDCILQISEDQHQGYPYTFVEKHWDDMYLELRCPLPININPGFSFRDDPALQNAPNAQSLRVARFVAAMFRWQRRLMDCSLDPTHVSSQTPQCMYQQGRSNPNQLPLPSPQFQRLDNNTFPVHLLPNTHLRVPSKGLPDLHRLIYIGCESVNAHRDGTVMHASKFRRRRAIVTGFYIAPTQPPTGPTPAIILTA